jgi:ferredoxin
VVTEDCIGCKFATCVRVCPVDCFREGELMLVIEPSECIDCGVCAPECEAKAIFPDTVSEGKRWADMNARCAADWPAIYTASQPLATANELLNQKGKYARVMERVE